MINAMATEKRKPSSREYERLNPGATSPGGHNAVGDEGADLPGGSDEDINATRTAPAPRKPRPRSRP